MLPPGDGCTLCGGDADFAGGGELDGAVRAWQAELLRYNSCASRRGRSNAEALAFSTHCLTSVGLSLKACLASEVVVLSRRMSRTRAVWRLTVQRFNAVFHTVLCPYISPLSPFGIFQYRAPGRRRSALRCAFARYCASSHRHCRPHRFGEISQCQSRWP